MTKVFLDTNVILDHALDRTFATEAEKILSLSETGKISAHISTGSLYTLAYVLEKSKNKTENVRKQLLQYLTLVTPIYTLPIVFEQALSDKLFSDIEDSFQYYTALYAGCDVFVTGNLKDFKKGQKDDLPVFGPDAFLFSF